MFKVTKLILIYLGVVCLNLGVVGLGLLVRTRGYVGLWVVVVIFCCLRWLSSTHPSSYPLILLGWVVTIVGCLKRIGLEVVGTGGS